MRGIVMVLMSIDHASEAFNAGRTFTDAAAFWTPGSALPEAQFLTRWITHLCAPTFVFLAGTALAFSVESRRAAGASERAIDLHLAKRGLLLVALDLVWMSPVMRSPGQFLCQVLYALGACLLFMIPLRRLGDRALFGAAVAWLALGELVVGAAVTSGARASLPVGLLVTGGFYFDGRLIVAYPAIPWLAIMALGAVVGRRLVASRRRGEDAAPRAARLFAVAGAVALAVFAVVRGIDGYGNMFLHRDDGSLVQWLHVSKYPPSLSFDALELGIMALALALLFALAARAGGAGEGAFGGPLRTIGQTALFYYLLHIHALMLAAWALGIRERLGLASAYAGAGAVLLALYPACARYRRYKAAHPTGIAAYI